jgi:hypothetical protein
VCGSGDLHQIGLSQKHIKGFPIHKHTSSFRTF